MQLSFKERLFILLLKAFGHLTLRQIYYFCKVIYFILFPFPLSVKRTIYTNLSRCMPELSRKELKKLSRAAFFQTLLRVAEMPFFWFAPMKRIQKIHWEVVGEDAFQKALKEGHGAFIPHPHLGAWEALNYYILPRYPAICLYRPVRQAYQDVLLKNARERTGVEMFPTNISGVRSLLESLKQGKCAAISPDHDPGDQGSLIVPFFNIPVSTSTLLPKLAAKNDIPVYFITAERLPRGRGFRMHFIASEPSIHHANLEQATIGLNQQIESIIRMMPAQYEWSYKRFRRNHWHGKGFYHG